MKQLKLLPLLATLVAPAALLGADVLVNANITSSRSWTKDNTYILDGRVFVTDGVTLTIETEQGPVQMRGAWSLVLERAAGGWKILHGHVSLPLA